MLGNRGFCRKSGQNQRFSGQSEKRPVIVPLYNQGAASIAHGPYDAHAPVLALEAGKEIIRAVYRKSLSIRSRFLR